jgi:hypothetical protein
VQFQRIQRKNTTQNLFANCTLEITWGKGMAEDAKYGPLFFLGAGASVAAGVPATFELVDGFLKELENNKESKKLEFLKQVVTTLKKGELGKNGVDVELLLEALSQMESASECIPLKFFQKGKCILGDDYKSEATELRRELQDFIKKKGLVAKSKIQYLKDLLMFTEANPQPLDIFSVNYDICIEQFCHVFEKTYTDGFYLDWEPKSLEREDVSLRLHKVHGSITWYETDKGSLVKLPIKSEAAEVELITGEKASALMLYPMRKLEYSEPLMSLLMMLRDKLSKTNFAFIIGYSFRDNQLKRIFWNAAKKNKELILFLVTPSAHEIYEKKLRKYDYELDIPSDLDGRVICLPYKFEKVLPLLSNYLRTATNALRWLKDCKKSETLHYETHDWGTCLSQLIECEYIAKIEEVLQKGAWEELVKSRPPGSEIIELAFKALLTSLISGNVAYRQAWFTRFFDLFSPIVETIQFKAEVLSVSPSGIKLRITPSVQAKINQILDSALATCNLKSTLVKNNLSKGFLEISEVLKKLKKSCCQKLLSNDEYVQLRKTRFPKETKLVTQLAEKCIEKHDTTELMELIVDTVEKVGEMERMELSENLESLKSIFETIIALA